MNTEVNESGLESTMEKDTIAPTSYGFGVRHVFVFLGKYKFHYFRKVNIDK